MKKLFEKILKHRKIIVCFYLLISIASVLAASKVKTNSNLADYLPEDSLSTISIDVMGEEFEGEISNASLMVKNISLKDAIALESKLAAIDGVKEVSGIGDMASPTVPVEIYPEKLTASYYKDNTALYQLVLDEDMGYELIDKIKEAAGPDSFISGSDVNSKYLKENTSPEVFKTVAITIVIALVILALTLESFLEPVILLICLGAAVIINSGTNVFLGEISFVTKTAASVLQMGVSVDYSIFLLHRYREYKAAGHENEEAMALSMTSSLSSLFSSALTTMIGFIALLFMRYRIGADLGIVLCKGILISLIVVFTLFPCLILVCEKIIDRTSHKIIIGSVGKLPDIVHKLRIPTFILFILLAGICLFAQNKNTFYYGTSHNISESTDIMKEKKEIENAFGQSNTIVIMVPRGDTVKETKFCDELEKMEEAKSVTSYAGTIGYQYPLEFIPKSLTSLLESEKYSRIVLNLDLEEESEETFEAIECLQKLAADYYGENYYIAGTSVSTYDLKNVISVDNIKVNIIAIGAIFIILLFTFHSLRLSIILVLAIEGSIWINMGIPYFLNTPVFYMGYLIVSSVLIGATVDYAILMANRYLEACSEGKTALSAKNSAIKNSAISILTSSIILATAGILLQIFSSSRLTGQLGGLLARGALIAAIVVLFVLPNVLCHAQHGAARRGKNKILK